MNFIKISEREYINLDQVTKVEAQRHAPKVVSEGAGSPPTVIAPLLVLLHYHDHDGNRSAQLRGAEAEAALAYIVSRCVQVH